MGRRVLAPASPGRAQDGRSVHLPRPDDVGTRNWIDPPKNRWAFRHVRDLTCTARI